MQMLINVLICLLKYAYVCKDMNASKKKNQQKRIPFSLSLSLYIYIYIYEKQNIKLMYYSYTNGEY